MELSVQAGQDRYPAHQAAGRDHEAELAALGDDPALHGEQVALPAPWPSGVWYWRLRGRDGAIVGDRSTPTWMVYVTDGAGAS